MAEIFHKYFASVYKVEDTTTLPTGEPVFYTSGGAKLIDIHPDEELVKKSRIAFVLAKLLDWTTCHL